ncbi:MAG: YCF48-related protein, partial [Gemmatimonadetes bacterium]|nr:YCF48-related protein [Gemmatimonadota bacterium]
MASTIYVGTIGQGVWRSEDGGDSWRRTSSGMFSESDIRAIAVHPDNASILFAGTETGICRSQNGGDNWEKLDSPMNGMQIWSIAIHPKSPNTVYAGTCPSALFRSDDGGETWKQLSVDLVEDCGAIIPRVTTIIIDPTDDQT